MTEDEEFAMENSIDRMKCKRCVHHVRVMKHPWNTETMSKGSVTEIMGYGCAARVVEDKSIVFQSLEHPDSGCEMFIHFEDDV